jgi:catechol 2,3-dioxygenase-like lactoylglutathione lyase family enzyme
MIDHASLGSQHYAAAVEFYRHALRPIGVELQRDTGREAAFARAGHWGFFVYPAETTPTAPGLHLAFAAASRDEVAAAHAAALAAGGQDLFTPRERPDISPSYFGAMFSDLDGHRIEVLTHAPG